MHNPHGNSESSLFLHVLIRNHLGFRGIGEKADLCDYCGNSVVPQQVVIGIGFDFSLIFLSCQIQSLCLYKRGETLTFFAGSLVEDLRAVLSTVRKTVLMDTHRTIGGGFRDDGFSVFQIAGFFIGDGVILKAAVRFSCHDHVNAVLFQNGSAFEGNGQINVLFLNAGSTDLSRVFPAVGRVPEARMIIRNMPCPDASTYKRGRLNRLPSLK